MHSLSVYVIEEETYEHYMEMHNARHEGSNFFINTFLNHNSKETYSKNGVVFQKYFDNKSTVHVMMEVFANQEVTYSLVVCGVELELECHFFMWNL